MKPIFKRLLSGTLSATMAVSAIPIVSAHADESTEANQKFRDLQEAPLIHGLQYDELIGLCNTNRTWLSDDYMNDGYLVIDCKKDIHSNG